MNASALGIVLGRLVGVLLGRVQREQRGGER